MSAAITFDGVSKRFRGTETYPNFRELLVNSARSVIPRARPRPAQLTALDDVSFEIPVGQSTALVGRNGAGKTTALKIISRITYPTEGVVRVRGRVGALIEVGTGMHPELSGRENIQVYGRILGHSGADISRRLDEIVAFAGIEAALEQPVKQYSSGMQLRLGFSVAAHLDPEVLLVDEAIAVGDAAFQYRCVERMTELVKEGRTLVFVSHDMSAVETLCDRVILLKDGKVTDDGPSRTVVGKYLSSVQDDLMKSGGDSERVETELLDIVGVSIHDSSGQEVAEVVGGEPMTVRVWFHAHERIPNPVFTLGLSDGHVAPFAQASMLIDGQVPESVMGEGYIDCTFADLPLQPRTYDIWGEVRTQAGVGFIVEWQRLRRFRVSGEIAEQGQSALAHSISHAPVKLPYEWRLGPHNGSVGEAQGPGQG